MSGKRKHHAFPKLKTTPLNSWNREKTKQWIETEGVLEERVMRLTVSQLRPNTITPTYKLTLIFTPLAEILRRPFLSTSNGTYLVIVCLPWKHHATVNYVLTA